MMRLSGYWLTWRQTGKKVSIQLNPLLWWIKVQIVLGSAGGNICCLLWLKTKTTSWTTRKMKTMILAAFQVKILFRSDLLLHVNSDQEPPLIKCFDVTAYALKNIFSEQLLQSVRHRLTPPLPLLSICLTEKHKLLATHTNKFLAMAQGTQCRKRRYDITLSSPLGPREDRRGERLREGGIERKRQQNRDKEGGQKSITANDEWSVSQGCYCQSHRCTNMNMQDLLDGMC